MATLNEREALLASVRDDPWDLTRLLVYADWLQENGFEKHAAQIRFGVAAKGVTEAVPPEDGYAKPREMNSAIDRLIKLSNPAARVATVVILRNCNSWAEYTETPLGEGVTAAWLYAVGLLDDAELQKAKDAATKWFNAGNKQDTAWWLNHRAAYWAADGAAGWGLDRATMWSPDHKRKHALAIIEALIGFAEYWR